MNPYESSTIVDNQLSREEGQQPSTWMRNARALVGVVTLCVACCFIFAIRRAPIPDTAYAVLVAAAAVASAWANVPLGISIGLSRGGVPVVVLLFVTALTIYCTTAIFIGGVIYFLLRYPM